MSAQDEEAAAKRPLAEYLDVVGDTVSASLKLAALQVSEALELADFVAQEVFPSKAYTAADVIAITRLLAERVAAIDVEADKELAEGR